MQLSDHDLRQLDRARLHELDGERLRALSEKLLADLKEARERLNQTPSNSSRPPSSRAPWERGEASEREDGLDGDSGKGGENAGEGACESRGGERETDEGNDEKPESSSKSQVPEEGRPGRRIGAPGASRTQRLAIDEERRHVPERCACCGAESSAAGEKAHNARYEIELVVAGEGRVGLSLRHTKHLYFERSCPCGHLTRAEPGACPDDPDWTVALSEWHLVGPLLASFICALSLRLGASYRRIREFFLEWFGLSLSTALISQCRHEMGRALEPVVEAELEEALRQAELVHVDETGWPQAGEALWLWVFVSTTTVLYLIGRRTRALLRSVLDETFAHWVMSDGYSVYRIYNERLRCWAHILRKARGLSESLDAETQCFGRQVLETFEALMEAVYAARAAPPQPPGSLRRQQRERIERLWTLCVTNAKGERPAKVRALAHELLNDWDTFWVILEHPHLPLTNNEAERALRHWVIVRRASQGTRTEQGSRVLALLASVIDTCRKRAVSPWPYLAEVLRQRRQGLPAPALPQPAN